MSPLLPSFFCNVQVHTTTVTVSCKLKLQSPNKKKTLNTTNSLALQFNTFHHRFDSKRSSWLHSLYIPDRNQNRISVLVFYYPALMSCEAIVAKAFEYLSHLHTTIFVLKHFMSHSIRSFQSSTDRTMFQEKLSPYATGQFAKNVPRGSPLHCTNILFYFSKQYS